MAQTRTLSAPSNYRHLGALVCDAAEVLRPPERLTVSEAAEKYRKLNNAGSYVGPWYNSKVPYMIEPMDTLTSRDYNAVVFVGPAQTGKTDALLLNWIAYSVMCDPADMMILQTTAHEARDFSKRRVDRMHRASPLIGAKMMPGGHNDNVLDKHYRNGMMLTLGWPAISQLSGKPIGRTAATDYDRMTMDVDGEGSPFDLLRKRTTSFKSLGMTLVESSPGKEVTDTKWIRQTPHQAPPCEGILALYNRGDRRRYYWPCPHCGLWFEGNFDLLVYPNTDDILEAGERAMMMCPHCYPTTGVLIEPRYKKWMNEKGRWLKEGQTIDRDGVIHGVGVRSDIASFWMKGVAAAFSTWQSLVVNYLKAKQEYERTGSQEALKSTVNTDQGEPYFPQGSTSERLPEELKSRAKPYDRNKVPAHVRFLMAHIDVQKNMWVVQVHGISPGTPYNITVIDRFQVVKSNRLDEDGERHWVKPSAYPEDWDLLITEVIEKEYELEDGSGFMQIMATFCDSGGREGVTTNAYNFWRRLRADPEGRGYHKRFTLLKGDNKPAAPRAALTYPDSANKDRMADARGEIPVLMLNVNSLKDTLDGMLGRSEPGNTVEWPEWLPDEFFQELTVEQRTAKGWENPRKNRNESWDLLTYCIGSCVFKGIEKLNWDDPPSWAQPWVSNALVRKVDQDRRFTSGKTGKYGMSDLGKLLG